MKSTLIEEIVEQLEALPPQLQEQVLALVRAMDASFKRGVSGNQLLAFAGSIPPSELQRMRQAIDEGCEQVARDAP